MQSPAQLANVHVNQLINLLVAADDVYHNGDTPLMTDAEYDDLRNQAQRLDPTNRYFIGVGSSVRTEKVQLPYQMGSLNQVQVGDLDKWLTDVAKAVKIIVTDKLDGVSVMLVYDAEGALQIAYTRGDGFQGTDIYRHISQIQSVPKNIKSGGPMVIRAEAIIAKPNFAPLNKAIEAETGRTYKNPRNAVAGMLNADTIPSSAYPFIDVVAYEIMSSDADKFIQLRQLDDLGFKVVNYVRQDPCEEYLLKEYLDKVRTASRYELDGIVLEIDSGKVRAQMYTGDLNPAHAIKYKIQSADNSAISTVTAVEFNISKNGYLKPTIHFEPVDLCGVTISKCTGFNAKFIRDNQIGPTARITITRSGDVIPFIQSVVSAMVLDPDLSYDEWFDAELLDVCSGWEWNQTGVDAIIIDVDNKKVLAKQMEHFFASIDAPLLGEGNIATLIEGKLDSIERIITASESELSTALNSQAVGSKIYAGLRKALTGIKMSTLMGSHPAFGRGVGKRKMEALCVAFNGDIASMSHPMSVMAVDGFSDKTARKVSAGILPFYKFLDCIKDHVSIADPTKANSNGGKLSGQTFVLTGFRDKELEEYIVSNGGTISSSVTKTTTTVIAADPSEQSTKLNKARSLSIQVVSRTSFPKE